MTFYNVRRSKDFFENLSRCKGRIDIVKDNGSIISFDSGSKNEFGCFDGLIRYIEVRFHNPEDANRMLSFMLNEKRSA